MKAECTLVLNTDIEILIESYDKTAINNMVELKEKALKEACENADFYKSINDEEIADNEASRARLLMRQISKLKEAI